MPDEWSTFEDQAEVPFDAGTKAASEAVQSRTESLAAGLPPIVATSQGETEIASMPGPPLIDSQRTSSSDAAAPVTSPQQGVQR